MSSPAIFDGMVCVCWLLDLPLHIAGELRALESHVQLAQDTSRCSRQANEVSSMLNVPAVLLMIHL